MSQPQTNLPELEVIWKVVKHMGGSQQVSANQCWHIVAELATQNRFSSEQVKALFEQYLMVIEESLNDPNSGNIRNMLDMLPEFNLLHQVRENPEKLHNVEQVPQQLINPSTIFAARFSNFPVSSFNNRNATGQNQYSLTLNLQEILEVISREKGASNQSCCPPQNQTVPLEQTPSAVLSNQPPLQIRAPFSLNSPPFSSSEFLTTNDATKQENQTQFLENAKKQYLNQQLQIQSQNGMQQNQLHPQISIGESQEQQQIQMQMQLSCDLQQQLYQTHAQLLHREKQEREQQKVSQEVFEHVAQLQALREGLEQKSSALRKRCDDMQELMDDTEEKFKILVRKASI
eukprot:TRINITY_DN5502_c0_g1_i10.p1 TRINITY_DN5502_c0_g1~~TRINITY_DN5502_c0_g1_i10.p1  ORF type:complete len:345 (-),score=38.69 TRINITY_DN5502_c0_g1_i10:716-1750(-)